MQTLSARSRLLTKLSGAVVSLLLVACGARVEQEPAGGESHFLGSCSGTCSDALTCIAELCTDTCEVDADCSSLAPGAQCLSQGGLRSCDVECTTNSECNALGSKFVCDASRCREASASPPMPSANAPTCQEGGQTYAAGATWPCSDGCNTCACDSDGNVGSTGIGCPEPTSCEEGGSQHAVGDSWLCTDGCNICTCGADGMVGSTKKACLGEPEIVCEESGDVYLPGDTWRCGDQCADCTCSDDGAVIREEELNCGNPATPFCTEGGVQHAPGDSWVCSDGCNTCSCYADGQVITTDLACVSDAGAAKPECTLAPEVGDCDAAFQKFYFDVELGECRSFTYGGCGGNANRYDSLDSCKVSCESDAG